jgi:hypothetical protein
MLICRVNLSIVTLLLFVLTTGTIHNILMLRLHFNSVVYVLRILGIALCLDCAADNAA